MYFDPNFVCPMSVVETILEYPLPQLWRTTRFWSSLPFLRTWRGGEFHPQISLPQPLLLEVDRQALQSGAGRARLHPGIYLDLLPPLRTECDQLAGTQTTKVGLFISKKSHSYNYLINIISPCVMFLSTVHRLVFLWLTVTLMII